MQCREKQLLGQPLQLSAPSLLVYDHLESFKSSKEMFVLPSVGFQKGLDLSTTQIPAIGVLQEKLQTQ